MLLTAPTAERSAPAGRPPGRARPQRAARMQSRRRRTCSRWQSHTPSPRSPGTRNRWPAGELAPAGVRRPAVSFDRRAPGIAGAAHRPEAGSWSARECLIDVVPGCASAAHEGRVATLAPDSCPATAANGRAQTDPTGVAGAAVPRVRAAERADERAQLKNAVCARGRQADRQRIHATFPPADHRAGRHLRPIDLPDTAGQILRALRRPHHYRPHHRQAPLHQIDAALIAMVCGQQRRKPRRPDLRPLQKHPRDHAVRNRRESGLCRSFRTSVEDDPVSVE